MRTQAGNSNLEYVLLLALLALVCVAAVGSGGKSVGGFHQGNSSSTGLYDAAANHINKAGQPH